MSPVPRSPAPGALPPGRGLVLPPADARPLAPLFARYLARCHEAFHHLGPRLPHVQRATHQRVLTALQLAFARNPRAVSACFASPTVGTALQCLGLREALPAFRARIDHAASLAVPHLLLELALRGLLPTGEPLDWPHGAPALASLSLGVALTPPAGATGLRFVTGALVALEGGAARAAVRFEGGRVIADEGFTQARVYRPVGGVTRLARVDHNPVAEFEAHPDKTGNHVGLGDRSEDEWAASLDEAFGLIEAHLPGLFAEMRLLLHEVVPVGFDLERHLSASYREAIGTVYVTLHPHVMTMAEALVHEFQHNKLNLASYETDFLHNAYEPRYRSPVRPDPRPLWGILLAVHAFLPVAALYRRMRAAGHPLAQRPDFERRLSEIDLKNHEGMEMLRAHAQWTDAGRALMDDLEALDGAHMAERAAKGLSLAPTDVHRA
jgi:HEXXH motif-containing protein